MVRKAIVEILEMKKHRCYWSVEREPKISGNVFREMLKMPEVLSERLTNWTDLDSLLSSVTRAWVGEELAYSFSYLN